MKNQIPIDVRVVKLREDKPLTEVVYNVMVDSIIKLKQLPMTAFLKTPKDDVVILTLTDFTDDKEVMSLPVSQRDDIFKQFLSQMIRKLAKTLDAVEYSYISEVWMVTRSAVNKTSEEITKELHPNGVKGETDAESGCYFIHETKDKQTMSMYKVMRKFGNKRELVPVKVNEDTTGLLEGKFSNVVYKKEKKNEC